MSLKDLANIIKEEPVSSIIARYVKLHKKGSSTKAICPFHNDTKPSMNVNDSRGMFMCFACHTGGDAITFVQKYKNLEFPAALQEISDILGLDYDSYSDKKATSPKFELAYKVLKNSSLLYRKYGQSHPQIYKDFLKDRGISQEIANQFMLGYAPGGNVLLKYLESVKDSSKKGAALKMALELGLIKQNEQNQSQYDTFRQRITFPIWDHQGRVQGHTSRSTYEDQKPKYLNSRESFVFNKKNLLYGLHFAESFIRERDSLILCEGNMDLIALHQFGFEHSIAIMGIAMSDNSARLLKAMTKDIYLGLDTDTAGYEASKRINAQFLENSLLPKYISFAPHKDPDEFLKLEGSLSLQERIDAAPIFIDVLLDELLPSPIPEVFDQKLESLEKMYELLAPLGDSMVATERLVSKALALGLKSGADQVIHEYKNFLSTQKTAKKNFSSSDPQISEARISKVSSFILPSPPQPTDFAEKEKNIPLLPGDKLLLQELLLNPSCLEDKNLSQLLDYIASNEVKRYVKTLRDLFFEIDEGEYITMVSAHLGSQDIPIEIKEVVGSSLYRFRPTQLDDAMRKKLVRDLIVRVQKDNLIAKRKELKSKQRACHTINEVEELMKELIGIDIKIKNISLKKNISFSRES